jgi:chromosome segregation ATPase
MNLYRYLIDGEPYSCLARRGDDVVTNIMRTLGKSAAECQLIEARPATAEELKTYELQNLQAEVEALRRTVDTLRQSLKLANASADSHRAIAAEQVYGRRVEMTAYREAVKRLRGERELARATLKEQGKIVRDLKARNKRGRAALAKVREAIGVCV